MRRIPNASFVRATTAGALAIFSFTVAAGDLSNIVKNGDFERAPLHKMPKGHPAKDLLLPPGWNMSWSFWGFAKLAKNADTAKSGKNALLVSYPKGIDPKRKEKYDKSTIQSELTPVEHGVKYMVKAWFKGGELNAKPAFSIQEYDNSNPKKPKYLGWRPKLLKPVKQIKLSDQWQLFIGEYTPSKPTANSAMLLITNGSANPLWIDGVAMRKADDCRLSAKIADSEMAGDKKKWERLFSKNRELRRKYGRKLGRVYNSLKKLLKKLKTEENDKTLTPDREHEFECQYDALAQKYNKIKTEINTK
jgi:hypothetical protein